MNHVFVYTQYSHILPQVVNLGLHNHSIPTSFPSNVDHAPVPLTLWVTLRELCHEGQIHGSSSMCTIVERAVKC